LWEGFAKELEIKGTKTCWFKVQKMSIRYVQTASLRVAKHVIGTLVLVCIRKACGEMEIWLHSFIPSRWIQMSGQLYHWGNSQLYALNERLNVPQSLSGQLRKEINLLKPSGNFTYHQV
jgi:hypothetical protein